VTQALSILDRRRAGILLHITSLPGDFGNGDLGREAYRFVDFLVRCGASVWQTLPINPTHPDGSPYQCLSAHAGNPALIDLHWLAKKGWLEPAKIESGSSNPDFRRLSLAAAFENFGRSPPGEWHARFQEYQRQPPHWLADFALFTALREELGGRSWQQWPASIRDREPAAMASARARLRNAIERVEFEQFVFSLQWHEVRAYARQRGILLFGDIPIFIASDSADVWADRDSFDLTESGQPRVVAGVPPDYFSSTGQRWGNPHYLWDRMQTDGFRWWLDRFRSQLELFDWVRIDHFRGFEAYWEIPAESDTAMHGHWVKAPGEALLEAVFNTFDGEGLPLVAENLGIITAEVEALRNRFDIPGMVILQFAFDGGPSNPYLPHNHTPNNVVYTGTHDNDTTLSWYEGLTPPQQAHVYKYLGNPEISMPRALVQSALASVAKLAILPMQDVLELGKGHRTNTPGTTEGNWTWRFTWDQLVDEKVAELAELVRLYGRHPES
jgi:4-alpha-glucanotransferase